MNCGRQPGQNGQLIDVSEVYAEYIRPALEVAGMEVFGADDEQRPGAIRADLFQELLLAERQAFSGSYRSWAQRMDVAHQKDCPGDLLVLADEAPMRALHREARRAAGKVLLKRRQYQLALEQFELALAIDADDSFSREKKALCLGRLGRFTEAREWLRQLIEGYPRDPACWALLGHVEKESWRAGWRQPGRTPAQMHAAASHENRALGEAIEAYRQAFVAAPADHHSGVKALTLQVLRQHCRGESSQTMIEALIGGVRWSCLSARERDGKDYGAHASYAELCLLIDPLPSVHQAFGNMVAAASGDCFALDSTRQTLQLLRDIDFRPVETATALSIVEGGIERSRVPFEPRQVWLFSGHMIDAAGREPPRFPAAKEALAAAKIAEALDALGAGDGDLALAQAASGGDLLFLEACQARGIRLQVMLPFESAEFIVRSVLPASNGEHWRQRYLTLTNALAEQPRIMPAELGRLPKDVCGKAANAFERCNLWLLYTALAWGIDKLRFVCLWNGGGGDGPGGTAHMYAEVKRRSGRVTWLDTRKLW